MNWAELNEREKKAFLKRALKDEWRKKLLDKKNMFSFADAACAEKNLALWAEHGKNIENFMLGTWGQWSS